MADEYSDEELGIAAPSSITPTGIPTHGPHEYTDEELGIAPPSSITPTGLPSHGPREYTDEELGIASPALLHAKLGNATAPALSTTERTAREARIRAEDPTASDPTAQMVIGGVLGGAAGRLVGPIASKLGPVLGRAVTGATEGGVSTKATGGSNKDALVGAALGGGLGALGGAVEGAGARVRARVVKNIGQGEGESAPGATAKLARKVAARAGEGGEELGAMLDENPGLEHTLSTGAARHPKEALAAVQDALDRYDVKTAPVYKAITDAGGVKLTDLTSRLNALRDQYGRSLAGDAIARERDALIKRYSEGFDNPSTATISGEELRKLRNEIGQAAFAGDPTAPVALKTQVQRGLYGAIKGLTEDSAAQLDGISPAVNLERFRAHNDSVSKLIPIKDALKQMAIRQESGESPLLATIKERAKDALLTGSAAPVLYAHGGAKEALAALALPAAARLAARAGRHIDYGLSRLARGAPEASEVVPAALAKTATTATVGGTAKDSTLGRLINGVRWFGRAATPEERNAAGVPASLEHAINTNNPNLGHASLANEVFGQ